MLGFDRRDLHTVLNLFRMNIRDRYLGSSLGSVWGVVSPLLMLGIFTFVFGYVYKTKLPGSDSTLAYAIWLIIGYGPWLAITDSVMTAAMSVVAATGLVKNLPMKTELLPVAASLVGILPLMVSMALAITLLVVDGRPPGIYALAVVPIALLQFGFIISLGFFLSSAVVFVRDIAYALPNLLMIILFATPIFYPIESTPRIVQYLSHINPLYILSEGYRLPLLKQTLPNALALAYVACLTVLLAYVGLRMFRRAKGLFEAAL